VRVHVVPSSPRGVDLPAALARLRAAGTLTLLVEGGARVITSMLDAGLVDRLVVGIAPTIIGAGTEAVGTLGMTGSGSSTGRYTCSTTTCCWRGTLRVAVECVLVTRLGRIPAKCQVGACLL
jgi:riboflavin biosynthesis pyrimidine reductase